MEEKQLKENTETIKKPDRFNGSGMYSSELLNWLSAPALKTGSELQALDCRIEWAVGKLTPMVSITVPYGRGGVGKTWLCLTLAVAVSRGDPFMGLQTIKMPVVYVDYENPLPMLVDRARELDIQDVLFWHDFLDKAGIPKLDSPEWQRYKNLPPPPCLIIIDTYRASQTGDENASDKMAFVMGRLKELRNRGYTIILIHHTPKSSNRISKGSTAITDLADHTLCLRPAYRNNPEKIIKRVVGETVTA